MKKSGVRSSFLDSGAFTFWEKSQSWALETRRPVEEFFDTEDYWEYLDRYVEFIQDFGVGIDIYANVDVIDNPELSWRNLRYLESKGLEPMPVVHFGADLCWLRRYVRSGYNYIGIGGLVGRDKICIPWLDEVFSYLCDTPDNLPRAKTHGFGVTSIKLLHRYPWYSVDSTSWSQSAAFGGIFVPHKRSGEWRFDVDPFRVNVSEERSLNNAHVTAFTPGQQKIIQEWVSFVGVGWDDPNGVVCSRWARVLANLHYFENLVDSLPDYPWSFKVRRRKTL